MSENVTCTGRWEGLHSHCTSYEREAASCVACRGPGKVIGKVWHQIRPTPCETGFQHRAHFPDRPRHLVNAQADVMLIRLAERTLADRGGLSRERGE